LLPDIRQHRCPIFGRGTPPEPVAVVDFVDHQPRLKHQRVRNHRVVMWVRILLYLKVLLYFSSTVREKRPLRPNGIAKFVRLQDIVGRDGDNLRISDSYLMVEICQGKMLLVIFGAIMPTRKYENHGVVALQLTQTPTCSIVIG